MYVLGGIRKSAEIICCTNVAEREDVEVIHGGTEQTRDDGDSTDQASGSSSAIPGLTEKSVEVRGARGTGTELVLNCSAEQSGMSLLNPSHPRFSHN